MHLGFDVVLRAQNIRKRRAGQGCAAADQNFPGIKRVKGRVCKILRRRIPMSENPQVLQRIKPSAQMCEVSFICCEHFSAVTFEDAGAAIQRSQQRIGRRTGLKDIQLPRNLLLREKAAVPVKEGSLRQGR